MAGRVPAHPRLYTCFKVVDARHGAGHDDDGFSLDDGRDDAETGLQRRELSQRVREAVDTLPDRQRAAFVLCFYEERSNKEAAELLGVSVKALESLGLSVEILGEGEDGPVTGIRVAAPICLIMTLLAVPFAVATASRSPGRSARCTRKIRRRAGVFPYRHRASG